MKLPASLRPRRVLLLAGGLLLLVIVALAAWLLPGRLGLPRPGSKRYESYAVAFQVGTAALDSNIGARAEEELSRAIELIPQEPAAWANRGLHFLRTNQLDRATEDINRAAALAPNNPDIEELLGYLAHSKGKIDEAIAHFSKASEGESATPARIYKLASLASEKGGDDAEELRAKYFEQLLTLRPTSLPVLVERALLANRRRDAATVQDTLARLERLSVAWKPETRKLLAEARQQSEGKADAQEFSFRLNLLRNGLTAEPGFALSGKELQPSASQTGTSLQQFLRLAPIRNEPDPADTELTFAPQLLANLKEDVLRKSWQQIVPVWLGRTDRPSLFVANASEVRRLDPGPGSMTFPGGPKAVPPSLDGVVPFDFNNDLRTDFLLAGSGGLRLYRQDPGGRFVDATAQSKLPAAVLGGDYYGAWAVDIDLDGDLDVVLARRSGAPLLLRNNGNGTLTEVPLFPGTTDVRGFAWLDLDNDGAADAVLLDAEGRMHVFMNERSGLFRRREGPASPDRHVALVVADVNDDGILDLVALRRDGALVRHSDKGKGAAWDSAELGRLPAAPDITPGEGRLIALDIDNNGAVDLIFCGRQGGTAWLADGKGNFSELGVAVPPHTVDIVSLEEGGQYDLLGFDGDRLTRHTTRPTRGYQWRIYRPRANPAGTGDQRINSFALGSEAEVRSGSLVVKQPVSRPVVHFGLGSRNAAPVLHLVWPNGAFQNEFSNPFGGVVVYEQRLSGSCPFLFSYDGEKMVFVADFLWSTPLGMYINGQDKGGFLQTTDWIRVRGDQLVPRGGVYDLRVNANLWETHFIDHLALMVVDHPPGSEMFVDERFFLQPTQPSLYLTEKPRPVFRALDHHGKDVTDVVRAIDGVYLDRAGRGDYQGVTADHWVEIDLGADAPTSGPVYLLAHGFIHPTDSSINFALEQNGQVRPQPLSLEIPDGKGGWKVGRGALGFPAGKNKTLVIRLDGIDGEAVSRRVRLRTNLEIYWDALFYARGLDAKVCKTRTLLADKADLQYRGILRMSQAGPGAPELPHYDEVVSVGQSWRDLIGWHTRFGDVRELLHKVDDRYVIMNAGDEIRLGFTAPPAPPEGWQRDFVWIADGWVKDGNLNTRFGKTVLPLPYHGMPDYTTAPGRLQDDPVYRRFPGDWQNYHTRHITPTDFEKGLRTFRRPAR